MPDFEMPYFVDGSGNKGNFKDTTAREQIAANAFANIIQTKTVTGTTNGYGDISLDLTGDYLVLSAAELTNAGGCYAIPRRVERGTWWACVYRENAKVANSSVTLEVIYVQIA